MKKAFAFFTLLLGLISMFAQSGPTFPYQAVVRNSQNQLIKDSTFAVDVEIYQGTTLKYSETQSATTNANGQFTMNIGGGTAGAGTLNDVADWSVAKFKITYHLSGGDVVSEQLVHPVPYALQAANVVEEQVLTLSNDTIYLTGGSYVKLPDYVLTATMNERLADTLNQYTLTSQLCEVVNNCDLTGNASLMAILNAMDARIDSLAHTVDSLSRLPHGGTPTAFTCGTDSIKDIDNNWYHTVQIGGQCWMKENLRTTKKPNNENITEGMWEPGENSVETYGRLYSWTTMMNGESSSEANPSGVQGICPTGWHVPSDAEWDTLTYYVFNSTSPDYKCGNDCGEWQAQSNVRCIANALSSTTGWRSNTSSGCNAGNTGDKANLTDFSAVPAGGCFNGRFSDFENYAYFWSATQSGGNFAWFRSLHSYVSVVDRYEDLKDNNGFSVRCVRD